MKDFRILVRAIFNLFAASLSFFVILAIGILIYNYNPHFLKKNKTSAQTWQPKDAEEAFNSGLMPKDVNYGYQLISESPKYMGPKAENLQMRYAGNNLACMNCHLKGGTQAGSASWVGVTKRFPQFRGRSNKVGTIEDRINGCMERSMNGKKLPKDSKPMKSIVAYMEWLSEDMPKEREKEFKGFPEIILPDVAVDFDKGKTLYNAECMICHGENGQGQGLPSSENGYQYPPLWGDDSFNNGAGMHRVITAAQFIKGNMPFGMATKDNPKLTDDEAYHLAGYINSFSRPKKKNLEKDYPDLKLKPVSAPYGPWVDNFSENQHKYGPFPPIITYYKEKFDLKKTK